MHSLKTSCAGHVFALAKPHDSVGKRTRNRIPKEERKTLVESFINKHQKLNNESFPSLSLTHKEVGGSFYTIRKIVREIIQENRVLGPGDSILEGTAFDQRQDQSMSSSIFMPVPPLSLSPDGFHSASDQNYIFSTEAGKTSSPENEKIINGSQASSRDTGSDILNCKEVNGNQLFKEDVMMGVHQTTDSIDISNTQSAESNSEENDDMHNTGLKNRVQTVCDSFATKPLDEEFNVDSNVVEEIPSMESDGTKSVNSDENVYNAAAAVTEMVNITKDTLGTTDLLAETLAETSKMNSLNTQPSELNNVSEGVKGTGTEVEAGSSTISHDFGEISLSTCVVLEEKGTEEVIVGQMPNHIPVPKDKKFGETIENLASRDIECADTQGTVAMNTVIDKIHETKEFSNGTLTTEWKIPTSGTESGSHNKNDRTKVDTMSSHAGNEVASVEKKTTMGRGKDDALDTSSSQKETNATLNRIKPESWKGESKQGRQETNPLLAVLKSFVTAFVKFWSE